jgi:hypothetical protein
LHGLRAKELSTARGLSPSSRWRGVIRRLFSESKGADKDKLQACWRWTKPFTDAPTGGRPGAKAP